MIGNWNEILREAEVGLSIVGKKLQQSCNLTEDSKTELYPLMDILQNVETLQEQIKNFREGCQ